MNHAPALPLWAGRTTAFVAILLLGLNLRTAVAALSPIVSFVVDDIPLDSPALGVMGMLPPIAFAASGIAAPFVAKRVGLEPTLVFAIATMVVGAIIRFAAPSFPVLVIGTIVTLAGMGFGNILVPPVVKKYFPDRIGQLTAVYATMMSIGTALPAFLAIPIAESAGWRVSLGVWGIVAATALAPWILLTLHRRRDARNADPTIVEAQPEILGRMWHSRVAWAILLAFSVSALNTYAFFAWLPELLVETAGVSEATAGSMLAVFGLIGLPASVLVPLIAARMRNVGLVIWAGIAFFVVGFAGLLLAPAALPWVWVIFVGAGPVIFPVCLVLINLRTRSPQASIALSGFVQTGGYVLAALGPLVVGLIHDATAGWTMPLLFMLATVAIAVFSAIVLARPMTVEDDLARRPQSN